MSDLLTKLESAVGDRYRVEEQVGSGGMSIVFRAVDTRHGRAVAIKVLRPEIALSIGGDRFLREISVAANLTHPNILPLHDSDQVDGMTYYVMPFVDGESLADRLRREGPLPVPEAVALTRQLAGALHYAHARGIVHRDLKPANVMLVAGQAMLADFGIARAIGGAHTQGLTGTGLALGTPAYMSPEQWSGDTDIDGRSDLYSLGCLLFEMLEGAPPFASRSVPGVMAAHTAGEVPLAGSARSDVPASLNRVIQKCMAKERGHRYQTGEELVRDLDSGRGPSALETGMRRVGMAFRGRARSRPLAAVGVLVIAGLGWSLFGRPGQPSVELREDVLAVVPFGTSGGDADPALSGLVADLVYQRIPGDHGQRALAPGQAVAALGGLEAGRTVTDDQAIAAARRLGASGVIVGEVSSAGASLDVTARILDARDGSEVARVGGVRGGPDDLPALADEVTIRLLAQRSGVEEYRIASLLGTNLPAVRAYLAARAFHEDGAYAAAAASYNDALDADTTFALAAIGVLSLNMLFEDVRDFAFRAWRLSWPSRATLDPRDQSLLIALVGPDYPADPSALELRNAWNSVLDDRPDEAEPWLHLGVQLYKTGAMIGIPSPHVDARGALLRASQLDPDLVWPWTYLLDLAVADRDTVAIRQYWERLEEPSGNFDLDRYFRWRVALVRSDTAALERLRAGVDEMSVPSLLRFVGMAQLDGLGISDAELAARTLRAKAARERETIEADVMLRALAHNRGRPSEALTVPWPLNRDTWTRLHQIMFGLYWEGHETQTEAAVQWVRDVDPLGAEEGNISINTTCALGLWELHRGDAQVARRAVAKLRTVANPLEELSRAHAEACAALLDAALSVTARSPDARVKLDYLDVLMAQGYEIYAPVAQIANLTAARLFDTLGEAERALTAVRRRRYDPIRGVQILSPMLLEEGRLAEKSGDVQGAIAAYRHFVLLQEDAEEPLRERLENVRRALNRLEEGG